MFRYTIRGTTVIYCLAVAGWLSAIILSMLNIQDLLGWFRANVFP